MNEIPSAQLPAPLPWYRRPIGKRVLLVVLLILITGPVHSRLQKLEAGQKRIELRQTALSARLCKVESSILEMMPLDMMTAEQMEDWLASTNSASR